MGLRSSIISVGTGSAVRIEQATWRDINAVRHIESVCFPKDAWPLLDIIGVLMMPNVIRLKAVQDGQVVGFIACDLRRDEQLVWIATIGVLPEYRRHGIGTAAAASGGGEHCPEEYKAERTRIQPDGTPPVPRAGVYPHRGVDALLSGWRGCADP